MTNHMSPPVPTTTPSAVDLTIVSEDRARRWTVLLRGVLALPLYLAQLALFVGALPVVVIGWFFALATTRLPSWARSYLLGCIRFRARVAAYLALLTDRYPPFALTNRVDYPVRVDPGPVLDLEPGAVLFRIVLAFPAAVVMQVLGAGMLIVAFLAWVCALVLGRVPKPLYSALAAALRYEIRYEAYIYLLTPTYPYGLFGDRTAGWVLPVDATHTPADGDGRLDWAMSGGARAALITGLVIGALYIAGNGLLFATLPRTTQGPTYVGTIDRAEQNANAAANRFAQTIAECGFPPSRPCSDHAQSAFADDLDRYAIVIDASDVPVRARTDAHVLASSARDVAADLRQLTHTDAPQRRIEIADRIQADLARWQDADQMFVDALNAGSA
jgi:hypothetical protein